jgi:hypothetical protein
MIATCSTYSQHAHTILAHTRDPLRSYADDHVFDFQNTWNTWAGMMENTTSIKPYMVLPGMCVTVFPHQPTTNNQQHT